MIAPDHSRLDELKQRYPSDPCRQIATYVLDDLTLPDEDRLCATAILGALDAADHAACPTVVEVSHADLMAAARSDAERLWLRYGEDESQVGLPGKRAIAQEDA
jgi:hypothetical protein